MRSRRRLAVIVALVVFAACGRSHGSDDRDATPSRGRKGGAAAGSTTSPPSSSGSASRATTTTIRSGAASGPDTVPGTAAPGSTTPPTTGGSGTTSPPTTRGSGPTSPPTTRGSTTTTTTEPPWVGGLKPVVRGLFDRHDIAGASYRNVVNGAVISAHWRDLQPAEGTAITSGNQIDKGIARARQMNAQNPGLHLQLKLRVYLGIDAPEWAKNLDGPPVTIIDPQTGATIGTVPRFWTARFAAAYDDLQSKLVAKYDGEPLIVDTVISRCTTQFAEPFIRQGASATNRTRYFDAGYTVAADKACLSQQIETHARYWIHTRSSLAFNPYKVMTPTSVGHDEAFTESMMSFCRQTLGDRCVLGNNSLGLPLGGGNDGAMYSRLVALGPPLYFQTETTDKIGDWRGALDWAASHGANMVELPGGYDPGYPLSELTGYDGRLEQSAS